MIYFKSKCLNIRLLLSIIILSFFLCGCISSTKNDLSLFKSLPASHTGINFSNNVMYDSNFNVNEYPFFYNGGGVAIGDINNDGLPDIYFSGNMVSSKLYINKGNLKFEDITESSGTTTKGWAGGVSMVDINNDGYLDIYVSMTGPENSRPEDRKNLLFINNQDGTFEESAESYGIADTGFSTHAVFFDFDLDGDLDLFLINNFPGSFARDMLTGLRDKVNDGSSKSADALYQNNGDGSFSDISKQAGILKEGYSLGVVVNDINRDGWPDIYVSNDVQTDDLLYLNNGDGTFIERAADIFKHTSYAGMGTDMADFNNDGWPDVLQVDMMPPDLVDQQLVSGSRNYEYLNELEKKGYQIQNNLNTLQLSNGFDEKGNIIFSEIGQLAGIEATEWSWAGLFGDYDNDGLKDIMITNGYPKALNNYDYIMDLNQSSLFGTDSTRVQKSYELMDDLHDLKVPNYFFKNNGDLTFTDVSEKWGFTQPTFSYGAAHADLDNDGDLDVVINNLNGPSEILENRADSLFGNNYLTVDLNGNSNNTKGIGANIVLTVNEQKQYVNFWPYRGYQSTMDHKINFGFGRQEKIDSLEIIWPDGKYQILKNLQPNQTVLLDYKSAKSVDFNKRKKRTENQIFFKPANFKLGLNITHTENGYVDFDNEPTLPQMLSRQGPPITVGDVNNNGRDDFYVGGAAGYEGKLYIQQNDGTYELSNESQSWFSDRDFEDIDAEFLDINGDGLLDLYIVSGGNEFSPASELLQDRVYINVGEDKFIRDEKALPRMYTSGSVVKPADYDGDGDVDLFIGGRLVPGQYPLPANSYILKNDGGHFTDVTAEVAPDLIEFGMITDAEWADIDGDGDLDLVTSGIWMPISFFENDEGNFKNVTRSTGLLEYVGWWNSIKKLDINDDGRMDFIVGNLGLNHKYSSPGSPDLHIFADNFDNSNWIDAIFAIQKKGQHVPLHGLRTMTNLLPESMQKVNSYNSYANSSLQYLVDLDPSEVLFHYKANYFSSAIILNNGSFEYEIHPLPNIAQISAINAVEIMDVDGDNYLDLIIAGNMFNSNPEIPRVDAGNGLLLLGDGTGNFQAVPPVKSGFIAQKDVKSLAILNTESGKYILVANNNSLLQSYKIMVKD